MIRNIVFDMGQVLLRFDPAYFIDRIGAAEEDKRVLLREVYKSLDWARMDRGSMTEAQAAESMCRRLPERLHETVHALVDRWDRPILPVEGMEELIGELKEKGYGIYLLSNASYRQHENWSRYGRQDSCLGHRSSNRWSYHCDSSQGDSDWQHGASEPL